MRVADEVWLAVARLHEQFRDREDFTIREILIYAHSRDFSGVKPRRSSFKVRVYSHCVAYNPPNPSLYQMLFETRRGFRRLFRPSDIHHPDREGARETSIRSELPRDLHSIADWYERDVLAAGSPLEQDPILSLRGVGKESWSNENVDQYVTNLQADRR